MNSKSNTLLEDLDIAKELVQGIGDDVVAEREAVGETGDGVSIEGHGCEHGAHSYIVAATEKWDYLLLQSGFNLVQSIAVRNKLNQMGGVSENEELSLEESDVQSAKDALHSTLKSADQDAIRSIRLSLIKNIGKEDYIANIDTAEERPFIHGFTVQKRAYHMEDDFHVGRFHTLVQELINGSWYGREFLAESYGLSQFIGSEEGSSGPPDTPGFQ